MSNESQEEKINTVWFGGLGSESTLPCAALRQGLGRGTSNKDKEQGLAPGQLGRNSFLLSCQMDAIFRGEGRR